MWAAAMQLGGSTAAIASGRQRTGRSLARRPLCALQTPPKLDQDSSDASTSGRQLLEVRELGSAHRLASGVRRRDGSSGCALAERQQQQQQPERGPWVSFRHEDQGGSKGSEGGGPLMTVEAQRQAEEDRKRRDFYANVSAALLLSAPVLLVLLLCCGHPNADARCLAPAAAAWAKSD